MSTEREEIEFLREQLAAEKAKSAALLRKNQSLSQEVVKAKKLRLANARLKASNQELSAGNKALTADIKKLSSANRKLSTTNEELNASNKELTTSNKELAASNKGLEADKKKLLADTERLSEEVVKLKAAAKASIVVYNTVAGALFKAMAIEIKAGEDIAEADLQRLNEALEQISDAAELGRHSTALIRYIMNKHSESTKRIFKPRRTDADKSIEELEAEAKKLKERYDAKKQGIAAREKQADNTLGIMSQASELAAHNAPNDPVAQAANCIAQHPVPTVPEKGLCENGKKTMGRQRCDDKDTAPVIPGTPPKEMDFECPQCGRTHNWTPLGDKIIFLRTLSGAISQLLQSVNVQAPVYQCKCGFVHMDLPEGTPVPAAPKQGTLSVDLVIQTGVLQTAGIPVNRTQSILIPDKDAVQLGSDTILRNTHKWASEGAGYHLRVAVWKAVCQMEGISFDETSAPILQLTGRSKKKLAGVKSQTGNIVALSSLPGCETPFAYFSRADGKSAPALKTILEKWEPQVVVTDGCSTYEKVLDELSAQRNLPKPILQQVCCIHFRRKLLQALHIQAIEEVVMKDNGVEVAARRIQEGNSEYLLCMVVEAFRKIYAYEALLRRLPGEDKEVWLERVRCSRTEHARPLMDSVDKIMNSLAAESAQMDKGHWIAKNKDDPLHKAVVYYLNHRDGLRLFLSDCRVPPDSNIVEQAIRFYVLYKQAAYFKQSPEYMESLCTWFTLVETGRRNGIKNIVGWLVDLSEAFFRHCYDWTLTYNRMDGSASINVETFDPRAIASFDWDPYLPWNYTQRQRD